MRGPMATSLSTPSNGFQNRLSQRGLPRLVASLISNCNRCLNPMLNPYQSENVESLKSAPLDAVPSSVDIVTSQFAQSRNAIALLSLVFGFISAICFFSFILGSTQTDSATGDFLLATDPLWILSNFIRSICFGYLSYELWQYQRAIKFWTLADVDSTQEFAHAHARVWRAGEIYLCVMVGYGLLNLAIGSFY